MELVRRAHRDEREEAGMKTDLEKAIGRLNEQVVELTTKNDDLRKRLAAFERDPNYSQSAAGKMAKGER